MSKRHRLTRYIEQLDEKSNSCNKKAICLACLEEKGRDFAIENKFTNTKKLCKSHLKNCENFEKKHGIDHVQEILDDTDSELTLQKRNKRRIIENYTSKKKFF